MNAEAIKALFGNPVSYKPLPHLPFKWKSGHTVAALIIGGLAAYGAYRLYSEIKRFNRAKSSYQGFIPYSFEPEESFNNEKA